MQRVRYKANKHGFTIFKICGGYLLFNKDNGRVADNFGNIPQPLNFVKNFLVKQDIKQLTEGLVTNE